MFSPQLNTAANLIYRLTFLRLTIFLILLLWSLGILYYLLFTQTNNILAEFFFANLYSTVCHQQSEKCISIGSAQMLVCARCAGIYFGALITGLSIFSLKSIQLNEKLLFMTLLILCSDVLFVAIGIYNYSKIISFTTGLLFGGSVYAYLMKEIETLFFIQKSISINEK